ncbi:MAG: hypothetical protein ACRDHL_11150 [Candidatus Promineifilaceae bacterium]
MSYRVIQASEIAEYVYCRRAWWLHRRAGHRPRNFRQLAAGAAYHRGHAGAVRGANLAQRVTLLLLFCAMAAFAFWLIQGP